MNATTGAPAGAATAANNATSSGNATQIAAMPPVTVPLERPVTAVMPQNASDATPAQVASVFAQAPEQGAASALNATADAPVASETAMAPAIAPGSDSAMDGVDSVPGAAVPEAASGFADAPSQRAEPPVAGFDPMYAPPGTSFPPEISPGSTSSGASGADANEFPPGAYQTPITADSRKKPKKPLGGPLGIAIIAIISSVALLFLLLLCCYCCRDRRRMRRPLPPPIFITDSGDMESQKHHHRTPYPSPAGHPSPYSKMRGTPEPLLDGSVRDSGDKAYHKQASPPFYGKDGKERQKSVRSSLGISVDGGDTPPRRMSPLLGSPSPEMLAAGRGAPSPNRHVRNGSIPSPALDVKLASPGLRSSVPSPGLKASLPSPGLSRRSPSKSPGEESIPPMQQADFGTSEGVYYGATHSLGLSQDSGSAELAAAAEVHLSVHHAQRVAVVTDDADQPGTPPTLVRTLTDTGTSASVEAMDLLERQLDWLSTSNGGMLFGKYQYAACLQIAAAARQVGFVSSYECFCIGFVAV